MKLTLYHADALEALKQIEAESRQSKFGWGSAGVGNIEYEDK